MDQVTEFFKSIGNRAVNPSIGQVTLDRRGAKSSLEHGMGRNKAIAFKAVPDVIRNGKIIDFQADWKGRGYDTVVIAAPVVIKGETFYEGAILIRENRGTSFYLHEVTALENKDTNAPIKTGSKAPSDAKEAVESNKQRAAQQRETIAAIEARIKDYNEAISKKKRTDTAAYAKLKIGIEYQERRLRNAQQELNKAEQRAEGAQFKAARLDEEIKNGEPLHQRKIERRKDYYHHVRASGLTFDLATLIGSKSAASEMVAGRVTAGDAGGVIGNTIDKMIGSVMGNKDISPGMVGVSDNTSPRTRWQGIMEHQGAGAYKLDSYASMADYIGMIDYMLAFDEYTSQVRDIANTIQAAADKLDKNVGKSARDANKFIEWMKDWCDMLTGKTLPFDRGVQAGLKGAGVTTYPFGDTTYFSGKPHCAGGGGGTCSHYASGNEYVGAGGNGGTNGSDGGIGLTAGSSGSSGGTGGALGGGTGSSRYLGNRGTNATFYGSGGGGGSVRDDEDDVSSTYGGTAGYQGVIYVRIPMKPQTISDFQIVEYLESTGTQYINTGVNPTQNTKMELDAAFLGSAGTNVAGVRNASSDTTNRFGIISFGSANKLGAFFGAASVQGAAFDQARHSYTLDSSALIMDGASYAVTSGGTFACTYPITLGAWNNGANGVECNSARIYSCKLYENGEMVRNFVPCYRKSDNVPGLWDKVENRFFMNAGTGSFTVGQNV